jgi:hypothetical protein
MAIKATPGSRKDRLGGRKKALVARRKISAMGGRAEDLIEALGGRQAGLRSSRRR